MSILKVEQNYLVKGNQFVDTDNVFEKKVFETIKYFTNVFHPVPGKNKSSLVHQNV